MIALPSSRTIEGALFAGAVISVLGLWCLEVWFQATMPRAPDPIRGLLVPKNLHGTTVYLSHVYQSTDTFLKWSGVLCGMAAVFVDAYADPFGWRSSPYKTR
jgi:hypothetical protein